MITSLGTCRFGWRSESTIASAGPFAYAASMSASIGARSASGRVAILASRSPKPLFTSTPNASRAAACFSNTGAKKVRSRGRR